MSKALIIGDVHLRDKAPSSRTPTYTQDILDKLQFCVETANEINVPIVQAGDMFDVKAPSRNSHRLVQQTHEVLKETKQGVWVVPGNHDLSHDRLDSLDFQPLGALLRMSNIHVLLGYDKELPNILGQPYLTEFDGGRWSQAMLDWQHENIHRDSYDDTDLIVTHAPIFPTGQAPEVYASITPWEWVNWWGTDCGMPKHTYYGHIHDCHGVFTYENHTFCNQGALSRGSLHEATIARKPAVTLWDGSEFTRIEVPHKPPEEVYLFDEATIKAIKKASAAEFASALGEVKLSGLTLESVYSSLRSENPEPQVMHIIQQLLEEVS